MLKNKMKIIKYVYLSLFILICLYLVYFNIFQSRAVASNSYNRRLRETGTNIIRGSILDRKGEVLAKSTKYKSDIRRKYTYGRYFSHIIGYTSKNLGSSGLEAYYNKELMSSGDTIETLRSKINDYYINGNSIKLTLDRALQVYATEQLGSKKGAVVVLRPKTGEVLAMVSKPNYNPSNIQNDWEKLLADKSSPLLNRATEGLYPPGSIFKLVTASLIINSNRENEEIECSGEVNVDGYTIKDYDGKVHGNTNLHDALINSCNSYFIKQSLSFNSKSLYDEALKFRFNRNVPSDIKVSQGVYPEKTDKKSVAQQSIGQGAVLMTPLHAALMVSAIANDGVMMQPYMVQSVNDNEGKVLEKNNPKQIAQVIDKKTAHSLRDMMVDVVKSGTGVKAKTSKTVIAGKTGTAEVSGKEKSHAWFVGFAPAENPEVAIAVIIEHGGSGGSVAAPIASKILRKALTVIE